LLSVTGSPAGLAAAFEPDGRVASPVLFGSGVSAASTGTALNSITATSTLGALNIAFSYQLLPRGNA
jgi:hypothetical protein